MKCTNNFIINGTPIPCMYCKACRINKITSWTIRILGEVTKAKKTCFLTLTYNNENLQFEDSIATLRKRHLQLFNKRLRKHLSKKGIKNIKYFACGEYGDLGNRPHYHIIYTGIDIQDAKEICSENLEREDPNKLIWKTGIEWLWGKGTIYFGATSPASIRYVISYCMEKKAPEEYEPAEPPFQISSNLFGAEWVDENFDKLVENGFFTYKGRKIAIPKFIKEYYGISPLKTEYADYVTNEVLNIQATYKNSFKKNLTYNEAYHIFKQKEFDKTEFTRKNLEKKEELFKQRIQKL